MAAGVRTIWEPEHGDDWSSFLTQFQAAMYEVQTKVLL